MGNAHRVVPRVEGAGGLEAMGETNCKDATQIVDFYRAMKHAGLALAARLGSKEHHGDPRRHRQWAEWRKNRGSLVFFSFFGPGGLTRIGILPTLMASGGHWDKQVCGLGARRDRPENHGVRHTHKRKAAI